MARLRHFAVCVKDLDKAAEFYAKVFDLKRVGREDLEIGSAIYMTDGVINLALLNFSGTAGSKASDIKQGASFVGVAPGAVFIKGAIKLPQQPCALHRYAGQDR